MEAGRAGRGRGREGCLLQAPKQGGEDTDLLLELGDACVALGDSLLELGDAGVALGDGLLELGDAGNELVVGGGGGRHGGTLVGATKTKNFEIKNCFFGVGIRRFEKIGDNKKMEKRGR